VIACLTTLPNIIHSDSPSESLATSEWQAIRKMVNGTEDDTLVLVWGEPRDVETGAKEVLIRAREAATGIPSETRQALRDGTNGFERILPGADRMYPDTDLPPKRVTPERLERIRLSVPLDFWSRESRYRSLGVPGDLIRPLSVSPFTPLFEEATTVWRLPPAQTAVALIQIPKRLRREGLQTDALTAEVFRSVLQARAGGRLVRAGVESALRETARRGAYSPDLLPEPCVPAQIEAAIEKSRTELATMAVRHPEKENEILMGLVMEELRGRADGARVAERVSGGKR
jgi:glutamyl-tRNA(Gln) amidotransferase subunit E